MPSRYLTALLVAAALAFACGPRPTHTPESASAAQAPVRPHHHRWRTGDPVVADTLAVTVGRQVDLALRVVNQSEKKVDVLFPDGRTYDFAVLDSTGAEVWRWSRTRMYTQALQSHTVAAGDTLAYRESWDHPASAHGRFTAVAVLESQNFPVQRRVEFTLP